jgi:hypothetical protein
MKSVVCAALAVLIVFRLGIADEPVPGWKQHSVGQLNGSAEPIELAAAFQIATERWNRIVSVPFIVYLPERDRLLMLVSCDAPPDADSTMPHRAGFMTSDDRGASWTAPVPVNFPEDSRPMATLGTGLAYLGDGSVLFYTDTHRWFSRNDGSTWDEHMTRAQAPDGKPLYVWDPPLVERDGASGKVIRIAETGYTLMRPSVDANIHQQAYIRCSSDAGQSWGEAVRVPQWDGVSEVALLRTRNGNLLAACRTDIPKRMGRTIDHFEGLGVSFSADDGRTWTPVEKLYDYGRHHPSLLLLPGGDIVMTYVVREGYVDTEDGFPQFGIEAVVSRDHGHTWDLDHRYLLHTWVGNRKREMRYNWWPSSQCTSSVLLPDGSILTAFGTGYRSGPGEQVMKHFSPRDVGLVRWRVNAGPVNDDRTIRDAPFDSELRNVFELGC